MAQLEQKFIVFNYVTSRMEQSDVAPVYGDPNQSVQQEATQAYAGSTTGAQSLSSAVPTTPTVSMLADPSANLISVAQGSTAVTETQLAQIQQSLGGLNQVGQLPSTITSMQSHASNVLENGTRVFEAIDLTYQPEQAGTPNRCGSLGDFIGSIQGAYNSTLETITNTLNQITNVLIQVPMQIIEAFTQAVDYVITAIQSGVESAINSAIQSLNSSSGSLFGSLGSDIQAAITSVGAAINQVQQAVQAEIDRVSAAISDVTNNLFRLVVPNVNPCLRDIIGLSNSSNFELPPLTQEQINLRRLSSEVSAQIAALPSA